MRAKDPNSKIGIVRTALLERWEQHRDTGALPTSGRFLYYELEQAGVIKKSRSSAQLVSTALMQLRRNRLVPWEDIVDETRTLHSAFTAPTILDWMKGALEQAKLDSWKGKQPLVLTESRSLAGVLYVLVHDNYRAMLASTNGQVGGFLHTDIAPALSPGHRVLYLGDLDKGGEDCEGNTRSELEEIVGPLAWERLAITKEQAKRYNIEPNVKFDRRHTRHGGLHEAIETEALGQSVIVEIVRSRLDELLPISLNAVLVKESRERRKVRAKLEAK